MFNVHKDENNKFTADADSKKLVSKTRENSTRK